MSLTRAAKGIAAFLVIALGVSMCVGIMSGGGYTRSPSINKDPRSVHVETVLLEYQMQGATSPALDELFEALDENDAGLISSERFGTIRRLAGEAAQTERGRLFRSPSIVVQHEEQGVITIKRPDASKFVFTASPYVLKDDVIRIAFDIDAHRSDNDSLKLASAFTSGSGAALVADQGAIDGSGTTGLIVAIRPTLVE